ncbi:hypothetical protein PGB90_008304 [Kerria lacca]
MCQVEQGKQRIHLVFQRTAVEVTDLARRVTCFTSAPNIATLSFKPIMVDMLDVVSIPVGDDTIECWMDIQRGKYPELTPLDGLVKIGESLTVIITITDHSNIYDARINDCWAYNSEDYYSKNTKKNVIDEEPSKLKDTTTEKSNITMDCADNEKYNLVIVDVQDENKYLNNSDDEHFLIALCVVQSAFVVRIIANIRISKSVSFFSEETTTVYSPVKNESIRKIQFVTTDNIDSDLQTEHVQLINTENLNETRKNEYDLLKSMLQLRLREVETETDAFRGENSHLDSELESDDNDEDPEGEDAKLQFISLENSIHDDIDAEFRPRTGYKN